MNWKGLVIEWGLRLALPATATLLLVALFRAPWSAPGAPRFGAALAAGVWVVTRLGLAAAVYGAGLLHPAPDFGCWVAWHAEPVLATGRPGLVLADGTVAGGHGYGPLLPYLQAAGAAALGPAGVLLPFLAGDALAVWAGSRLARDLGGEAAGRWACAWLVLTPLLWHQSVIHAQDEALFAGLLLAGTVFFSRGHDLAGAATLALGLVATKITFGLYGAAASLALLPDARRLVRAAASGVIVAGAVCGAAAAAGVGFFRYTVDRHLASKGASGGSLPDDLLAAGLLPATVHAALVPWAAIACAGGVVGVAVVLARRAAAERPAAGHGPEPASASVPAANDAGRAVAVRALALVAIAHALFTLLLPGALPGYAVQGLPAIAILLVAVGPAGPGRLLTWLVPALALAVALRQRAEVLSPDLADALDAAFKVLSATTALTALAAAARVLRGAPPRAD